MEKIIKPIKINRLNFATYGDLISTNDINPMDINEGYAKRFDNLADLDTLKDGGKTIVSIFSALKRTFPMIIIPPKMGVNYKPGIWHFPLISTENTNFLVIDRKGNGENLIIHKFEKDKIFLEY